MKVLLNRGRSEEVDLRSLLEQVETSSDNAVGGQRNLADRLITGNTCVVTSVNVNGLSRNRTHYFFNVGERGLFVDEHGGKKGFAIDVGTRVNPASQLKEAVVLKFGAFGFKWLHHKPEVSLSYRGVGTTRYFNEHTFSNHPGSWISHDSGEYLDSIAVGQSRIKRDWSDALVELDLRSRSVPFVLPIQYFDTQYGIFGNSFDASTRAVLGALYEEGILEKPMSYAEMREVSEKLGPRPDEITPSQKGQRTKIMNRLKRSSKLRKEQERLAKALSRSIEMGVHENILLNSIGSVLNLSDYRRTERGYRVVERNKEYEADPEEYGFDSGRLIPKRAFELVPSRLQSNVAYAIPEDEAAGLYLLGKLIKFNEKFPDTRHIPKARENYVPFSVVA